MARTRADARSGVLVVDKAGGITSADVVSAARRALAMSRIGHGGTLDPDAIGVLPLLIGEATKLMPYLVEQTKEYVATIRLGVTTDTQDVTGRVTAEAPVPALTRAQIERAVQRFVGVIRQVPPMYSAVHHEGRRLYEIAREGGEVPRTAREVSVHSIAVETIALPTVQLRIVCGKGTYVRTLAADLGDALGCGGAVERLIRVRVGPFGLAEAVPSSALTVEERGALLARLLPPEAALRDWGVVRLGERDASAFLHGQQVALPMPVGGPYVQVRHANDTFLGIGEVIAAGRRVRPARIVHADRSGTRVLPA
jgi:tRNA pseudouridine55 synthase